jgi:ferric iron reductase protein FhuF
MGPGPADESLIPATRLLEDDEAIAQLVAARARGLELKPGRAAAVLWMQSYAYRVAGPLLAAWVLHQRVPDLSVENIRLRFDAEGRPVEVRLVRPRVVVESGDRVDDAEFLATPDLTAEAIRLLLDGHLMPILKRLSGRYRLGALSGQGAIASQLGMALTFIDANAATPWIEVARVAVGLFERSRDRIGGEGKTGDMIVTRLGDREGVTWRRRTCCLVHQAPQREKCGGCPLRSEEERLDVWARRLASRPASSFPALAHSPDHPSETGAKT